MGGIDYKEVGRRIAVRRKELGLKQYELCEKLGVNYKYISNIETGRSAPSLELVMNLCGILGTTPDYFLVGTENVIQPDTRIANKSGGLSDYNKQLLDRIIDAMLAQQNK